MLTKWKLPRQAEFNIQAIIKYGNYAKFETKTAQTNFKNEIPMLRINDTLSP